jgi:hypothetical protein
MEVHMQTEERVLLETVQYKLVGIFAPDDVILRLQFRNGDYLMRRIKIYDPTPAAVKELINWEIRKFEKAALDRFGIQINILEDAEIYKAQI